MHYQKDQNHYSGLFYAKNTVSIPNKYSENGSQLRYSRY